jgi:hypothetical protein
MLLGLFPCFAHATTIILTVDGRQIYTDVPPTIVEGRVLVPVRNIFDALQGAAAWDAGLPGQLGSRQPGGVYRVRPEHTNGGCVQPGELLSGGDQEWRLPGKRLLLLQRPAEGHTGDRFVARAGFLFVKSLDEYYRANQDLANAALSNDTGADNGDQELDDANKDYDEYMFYRDNVFGILQYLQ